MSKHIDSALAGWDYEPGGVQARLLKGEDGRTVIQMRVDLGILQLETTGRPDGTGGDGRHASHWKDEHLTGQHLGVMNPVINAGEHPLLTDEDLSVLEAIGYRTKSLLDPTTIIPLASGQPQTGGHAVE